MKNTLKTRVIIPLTILFAVLVALAPRAAKWGFDYRKGSAWRYETLVAQFDFPLLKTSEQIEAEEAELESRVIPFYRFHYDLAAASIRGVDSLSIINPEMKAVVASALGRIYEKGVMPDNDIDPNQFIYVRKDKYTEKIPASETYRLTGAREALLSAVEAEYPGYLVDRILRGCGAYALVVPNLTYDEQMTSLAHNQNRGSVSPTSGYIAAGTTLVKEGELVTAEICQVLDSYRKEYEENYGHSVSEPLIILGNALIALLIVVCLFFAVFFGNPMVFKDYNRFLYVLTVFLIMTMTEFMLMRFAPEWIFAGPYVVGALYLQAFFRTRVIYPVYIVMLLPLLIYADNGAQLYVMYLASGTVTLYLFRHLSKGVKQFLAAIVTFAVTSLAYLAFRVNGTFDGSILHHILLIFAGSMLDVAVFPLIYLMERVFNLVSQSRLQELSDMSNGLLRLLEQKAPGSFQHSLQVVNMCSAAARAIGADETLVRTGALYHDIGKTNNPLCFVENESLSGREEKYHDSLTPVHSAQDIIKHVTDGVELAKSANLPPAVIDFILTHHGTGCVSYFYDKHISSGGDPALKVEFCYPGKKPQTKEQVILMLCDSLEAASRTIKDYSPESIAKLVDRIFKIKTDDEQLSESDITVKELNTLKDVLSTYIFQVHHERIKYPERHTRRTK